LAGEANNGEHGLEMALRLKPELVCLDILMPKTDGLEVLKQIKAALPRTVVVMVTGSTERETVQAAIAGGADGYIVKPFNSARVLDTIKAALEKMRSAPAGT
jgi:two-component system chemotaxis response regulator CheY